MFVLFIFFAVVALVLAGVAFFAKGKDKTDSRAPAVSPRLAWGISSVAVGAIAGIILLFSMITSVGTKDIGVITAYGHTEGELGPGLHLIAPWESVSIMDGAIQTDSFTQANNNGIPVRLAFQQTATANLTVRWRINRADADSLYQNYRTFSNVRDSLVTRDLSSITNSVLGNYNPLNSIDNAGPNPSMQSLGNLIAQKLAAKDGPYGIKVLNVLMFPLSFQQSTQNRLNQLQTQVAATRVAQQLVQTNAAQQKANSELSNSKLTEPVEQANCITLTQEAMKDGYQLPAGWNCNYTGNSSGLAGIIANTSTSTVSSHK